MLNARCDEHLHDFNRHLHHVTVAVRLGGALRIVV